MDARLEELLRGAFREVPALEANQAIARARRERAGGDPDDDAAPALRSYELVLSDWQKFVQEQVPKLVYHLESIGSFLPECHGVMISAFAGDRLFFIDAKELLAGVCRALGVTPEQLSALHGLGERRTAIREQLLLPEN